MHQDNPSEYIAAVSHDLKSPLNAIIGFIDIIRQDLANSNAQPQVVSDLGMMENIAKDMLGLINNMLVSSRIRAGKEPLRPTIVEKADLISRVASLKRTFEPESLSRKVNFSVEVKQLPAFVFWDIQKIRYFAVNNLISNALKFVGEYGTVKVTVDTDEGGMVIISVADNGLGIPLDERDAIFDQYTQASNNQKKLSGSGFGLFNVAHVIREHHGTISIRDGLEGKGVTFELRIPAVPFPLTEISQEPSHS